MLPRPVNFPPLY